MAESMKTVEQNKEAGVQPASSASPVIPELVVELRRPFEYVGETYNKFDLSGLAKLTARDDEELDLYVLNRKDFDRANFTYNQSSYIYNLAYKASGVPADIFRALPIKTMRRISEAINIYLDRDGDNGEYSLIVTLADGLKIGSETKYELDLSALDEGFTGNDTEAAEAYARRQESGKACAKHGLSVVLSQAYQFYMAAFALGVNPAVLQRLSYRDAMTVRLAVIAFLADLV